MKEIADYVVNIFFYVLVALGFLALSTTLISIVIYMVGMCIFLIGHFHEVIY